MRRRPPAMPIASRSASAGKGRKSRIFRSPAFSPRERRPSTATRAVEVMEPLVTSTISVWSSSNSGSSSTASYLRWKRREKSCDTSL